jgi:hypothetical protein
VGNNVGSREVPGEKGCDKGQQQQQKQHNNNSNSNNNNNNNNLKGEKVEPRYGRRYSDWIMNWTIRGSNGGRGKSVFRLFSQNCEKRLLASSCLSFCQHGTTRLSLDGFALNLIFEYFSQIC